MSSSPDPLSASDENNSRHLPNTARRQTISPRKVLTEAAGNARIQEFHVTTPPAKYKCDGESPWRIRLTVQAERLDGSDVSLSPVRLTEKTTTTRIPLKGGDEDSVVAKRGRGRPRNTPDNLSKRNGTPKPKAAGRRKTMPSSDTENSWAPTPPRKNLAKERKSAEQQHECSPLAADTTSSPVKNPARQTPERTIKARPFSRTKSRSRSRRQEITPMKVAYQGDTRNVQSNVQIHSILRDSSALDFRHSSKANEQDDSLSGIPKLYQITTADGPERSGMSLERSTLDVEDEHIRKSMIRQHSVSPARENSHTENETTPQDPVDEHQEYDTILESEGFSMVSVESLQSKTLPENNKHSIEAKSTPERDFNLESPSSFPDCQDMAHFDKVTASMDSMPLENDCLSSKISCALETTHDFLTPEPEPILRCAPDRPEQSGLDDSHRIVDEPIDGTPKLQRVARAGAALQSVPSPHQRAPHPYSGYTLASPFTESKKYSAGPREMTDSSRSRARFARDREQSESVFDGFSAATRRELRAGLRLGEELAKRERTSLPLGGTSLNDDRLDAQSQSSLACPQLPIRHVAPRQLESQKEVRYPMLANTQLPSPARSDIDADEDRMQWQTKDSIVAEKEQLAFKRLSSTDDVDYTMLAREAEWQREREAVSKQIREANTSQVIVINSDDEDLPLYDSDDESRNSTTEKSPGRAQKASEMQSRLPPDTEIVKYRRSKIPTPWRRQTKADTSKASEHTASDLFWQPDLAQTEAAKKRQERKKQRKTSQSSSPVVPIEQKAGAQVSPDHVKLTAPSLNVEASTPTAASPISLASPSTNDSKLYEHESDAQETEELSEDCIQLTDELLTTGVSVSFAPEESAASVPLPESPPLGPIDPALVPAPKLANTLGTTQPMQTSQTSWTSSSWFAVLTAPLTNLFVSAPKFPYPPATLDDILESSPYEPLILHLPWTEAHTRALAPVFQASTFYTPEIFPYDSRSMSAYLLGARISSGNGWSRIMTKADCGVIDAFLTIFRHRGVIPTRQVRREEHLGTREMASQILKMWTIMIMNGETKLSDWKGARAGIRYQMDRKWREEDIDWASNRSRYFDRKRAEFEQHGLPSWQAQGLVGPFILV